VNLHVIADAVTSHVTSLEVLASPAIKSLLSHFIFFSTTPTFIDLTTGFDLQGCKVVGTSLVSLKNLPLNLAETLQATRRQSKHRPFLLPILSLDSFCRATKLRVPRSNSNMTSGEQVNNDYGESGDSTNGGPILGVDPNSNQTIEPKTNIPDESSFGALPPEIRNIIYWYVSVKPTRIHLAAAFKKQRYKWHDDATSSKLSGFGVPSIAQTNKQFRRECLGVYYGMNTFVFVYNAGTQRSERVSCGSLRDTIDIIGRSVKMMQPKALEMRFTSTRRMNDASLRSILGCFVLMHFNGVRRNKNPNSRII
jgi:hypothetical protein